MAKLELHKQALALRKKGKSYFEIKKILGVSKSTLSNWLHNYPLSKELIRELRDWNSVRIEKYIATRRRNRETMLKEILDKVKLRLFPMSKRDLYIAGLFLYWGEGGKTQKAQLILSNSNPAVIKMYVNWLEKILKVDPCKLKIKLHLYSDMDILKEKNYWAKLINITVDQFSKPYIKESKFSSINYKNGFGHGTCNVILNNAILARKILMSLKAIENYYIGPVA